MNNEVHKLPVIWILTILLLFSNKNKVVVQSWGVPWPPFEPHLYLGSISIL